MLFFILGPLLMLTEVAGEIVLPKIMASMIDSVSVRKSQDLELDIFCRGRCL